MNTWNAGQILTVVKTINKMDIEYLGDENAQNQTLIQFMNLALWNLARLCYNTDTSDILNIAADGPVNFKKGVADVKDAMFEPLRLIEVTTGGTEVEAQKRYSDTAPVGWYRESENQPIDCRGLRGNFKLKYIRYPRQVVQNTDPVDISEAGYKALIMEMSALIKNVKNYYSEAEAMSTVAKQGYGTIVQSAISAKGPSSGGQPPSMQDATIAKGG